MKKHLSVFMLYIRATFLPALLLIFLTAGVSAVLFAKPILEEIRFSAPGSTHGVEILGLETVFGRTAIPVICTVSLILLTVLLIIPGTAFGSQTSYTMSRLCIGEKSAFLWQAGYNALMFLFFWAVEAIVLYGLCLRYGASVGTATEHTVFLALYRDEFLHSMIPLHDIGRTLRNLSFCIGLGVMTAHCTAKQRTGKKGSFVLIPMLLLVIRAFPEEMGSLPMDIINIVISLFFAVLLIVMMLTDNMRFLLEEEGTEWKE